MSKNSQKNYHVFSVFSSKFYKNGLEQEQMNGKTWKKAPKQHLLKIHVIRTESKCLLVTFRIGDFLRYNLRQTVSKLNGVAWHIYNCFEQTVYVSVKLVVVGLRFCSATIRNSTQHVEVAKQHL